MDKIHKGKEDLTIQSIIKIAQIITVIKVVFESNKIEGKSFNINNNGGPEACIDKEQGGIVGDPLKYPYSAIGKLCFQDKQNRKMHGTAFLISQNYIMTAYHNLFDFKRNKKYTNFYFLLKEGTQRYQIQQKFYLKNISTQQQRKNGDYAILKLKGSPGKQCGYFGLDFQADLQNIQCTIAGFPGKILKEKNGKWINQTNKKMYQHSGKCEIIYQSDQVDRIKYKINTFQGSSGSPIFYESQQGKYYVIGVHTDSADKSSQTNKIEYNQGVLLTQKKKEQMNEWIREIKGQLQLGWRKDIDDDKVSKIFGDEQMINTKCMQVIQLQCNKVTSKGVKAICKKQLRRLRSLALYQNQIGDEGLMEIVNRKWESLQAVYLNKNNITEKCKFQILSERYLRNKKGQNIKIYF